MEGILYEDVEFNTRVFPLINRIKIYSRICYNYTCRHGSILNSISEKRIEDLILFVFAYMICFFKLHINFIKGYYQIL